MEPDRRTRILDATCRLIARDGAGGVRAAAIAREAGVSQGLALYYWPSIEALVLDALAHHERSEWERTDRALADLDDPLARLRLLVRDELAGGAAAERYRALWAEYERVAAHDPAVRRALRARNARWEAALAHELGAARAAGRVRPDLDAAAVAARLSALATGLATQLRSGMRSGAAARAVLDRELEALEPGSG